MKFMNTKLGKIIGVGVLSTAMVGCGEMVEVGPSEVGKIMGEDGYKAKIVSTSKFRLPFCWNYCDKLVILDAADMSIPEDIKLYMPKDKLTMDVKLRVTVAADPTEYDYLFSKITPKPSPDGDYFLPLRQAYNTYARDIIRAEASEYLSQFTISEIASSRDAINSELSGRLAKSINARTPFRIRYLGLSEVTYPQIITDAQEKAAERREQIEQENAQGEIKKAQLERELMQEEMRRAIEVKKAMAQAEVNRIIAESMSENYKIYRSFEIMEKMANSENKVFMPVDMLSTTAGQMQLGK